MRPPPQSGLLPSQGVGGLASPGLSSSISTAPRPSVGGNAITSAAMFGGDLFSTSIVSVTSEPQTPAKLDQLGALDAFTKQSTDILKQVWDLSDQDYDCMLSLREFCIALYLMERYREGQNLPPHFLVMSCLMKLCCLSRAHLILLVDLLVGELILVYLYTSCRHIFRVAKWEVGWLETGQNGLG
ncbi:epidermal growth factor receptor substrate 15-like protein 1 [Tanacetum coccineum]